MNYKTLTEGQLMDRMNILANRAKSGKATQADRSEFDAIDAELERRSEQWRSGSPREERFGPGASDSDILAADGRGYSSRTQETAEEKAFDAYLRRGTISPELRAAQQTDSGPSGAFTIPQGFWDRLAIALKQYGGISGDMMQVNTETGNAMPWATTDPTSQLAEYITEGDQITDSDVIFGQGMMFAWTMATLILASRQFVQDSSTNVSNFVAARVGERIGRKVAAEVVSGAGSGSKALTGIYPSLTAFGANSDSGGYVALDAAAAIKVFGNDSGTELGNNVLSPGTLVSMLEALDPAYLDPGDGSRACWYMNKAQAWNSRALVDDNNRPLVNLDSSFADGAIGSLFGLPVKICQELTDITASAVSGPILANMQHAFALRTVAGGASIQTLVERYADYLQVGYLAYVRMDSQPNDLRALVGVKANSS